MKKITGIRELNTLFSSTQEYLIEREKAEYQDGLNSICCDEDIKERAKSIAALNSSCNQCIYCDGVTDTCYVPYSDGVMEDLDIDPCYEGVLNYLNRSKDENDVTIIKETGDKYFVKEEELEQFINDIHSSAYENLDTIRMLTSLIIDIENQEYHLGESSLQFIKCLYNTANDALNAANL